jgi:SPP1 gp7 family putative phage head morphogenesis protein
VEDLIEAYNTALKNEEQKIIDIVNGSLDRAFNRLLRRTYGQLRSGRFQTAERNARALELIPPLRPDQADEYLSAFQRLLSRSTSFGLDLAGQLSKSVKDSQVGVTVPVEAVVAAARTARGYLERHGATFSTAAAEVLSQGVAEGRPTEEMTKDLQRRLKVTKSRAEVIVRTESLRAHNEAANAYYTQNGIDLVMYYATTDDRSCPYCTAHAGNIFKRGAIAVPRHPRCRCYLAPYSDNVWEVDPEYDNLRKKHRQEVLRYARNKGVDLSYGPSVFEELAPIPTRET